VERRPGARGTRQRAAIAEVLAEETAFRTAQELHARLRDRGDNVGLTTVYRALQALAAAGEVDVVRTDDGEAMYRRCRAEHHHHHIVCRSCGTTAELPATPVEDWVRDAARRHGFTSVTHTAELFGLCADCD
jgi:Fur family transcriptional regulator, ferric uptake regulator